MARLELGVRMKPEASALIDELTRVLQLSTALVQSVDRVRELLGRSLDFYNAAQGSASQVDDGSAAQLDAAPADGLLRGDLDEATAPAAEDEDRG